jgi:hypothetical protein
VVTTADSDTEVTVERMTALQGRIASLRMRTDTLRAQALEVGDRARASRDAPRATGNYAVELDHVRNLLSSVETEMAGLRIAMRTRAVIEQAKGMLMAQHKIDAEAAFGMLVQLSQTTHRKLVEVAGALVESWATEHAES